MAYRKEIIYLLSLWKVIFAVWSLEGTHTDSYRQEGIWLFAVWQDFYTVWSPKDAHNRSHWRERMTVCSVTHTVRVKSLIKHQRNSNSTSRPIEEKKLFVCYHCGKSFSMSGSLKIHKLTYTGEKGHDCLQCAHVKMSPEVPYWRIII